MEIPISSPQSGGAAYGEPKRDASRLARLIVSNAVEDSANWRQIRDVNEMMMQGRSSFVTVNSSVLRSFTCWIDVTIRPQPAAPTQNRVYREAFMRRISTPASSRRQKSAFRFSIIGSFARRGPSRACCHVANGFESTPCSKRTVPNDDGVAGWRQRIRLLPSAGRGKSV